MRVMRLLMCLAAAGWLAGCDIARQPFSCEPGVSFRIGSADRRPAVKDADGYYHCL